MSEIETPPIKVVPMFIDEPEPVEPPPAPVPRRRWYRPVPGIVAFAMAIATVVLLVIAIELATAADFATSTTISWAAMITSTVAVLGGVAAIALRWGRGWGIAAVVIGLVGNPYLLLQGLTLLARVTT